MDEPNLRKATPKFGLDTRSIELAEGGLRRRPPTSWGPRIREPQETIQIHRRGATVGSTNHPFQLFPVNDSGCKLYVWRGAVTVNGWAWSDTEVWGVTVEKTAEIGGASMLGPGIAIGDVNAGYLSLTASTTYGVWMMVEAFKDSWTISPFNPIPGLFPDAASVHFQSWFYGGATIVASSTNTDELDAAAQGVDYPSTGLYALAFFLGQVVVDSGGNASFTEYRKSDITITAPLLSSPVIVSTDTSSGANTIVPGVDGGAYLP